MATEVFSAGTVTVFGSLADSAEKESVGVIGGFEIRGVDCGFVVELGMIGSAYVPKGLSDDFGDGPLFVNVCLTISW